MKKLTIILLLLLIPTALFAGINLIDRIVPKNEAFTGLVEGDQVICEPGMTPPTACFADVWINVDGGTLEIPNSTTLPGGTCNTGEIYMDTNATSGQQIYGCEAGSWVLQGDGGAGADDLDDVCERGDETDVWITVGGITAENTVYATDYLIAGDAIVDSGWVILYGGGVGGGGGTVKLYEENGTDYAYIRPTPSGFAGERVLYIPDVSGTIVVNATGTEVDPQVGAVTNAKWCVGDGDSIECTKDAPAGTGDMTKLVYDTDDDGTVNATESDVTWTLHNSYPACCYAGTYITCVGDTLTCDTPEGVLGTTVEDTEMAAEDFGDFTCTGGEDGCSVDDDSHAHTSSTLSGIDISVDTNLAVSTPITLTGDSVGMVNQGTTAQVLHGNAAGNPAFSAVDISSDTNLTAGRSLTLTLDETNADAELYTDGFTYDLENPVTTDNGRFQTEAFNAMTVTRVSCSVDAGSVAINIDERAFATPDTNGTDVLSAVLVCDTDGQSSCASGCDVNTINNAAIDLTDPIALEITAIVGTPTILRVNVKFTKDD